MVQARRQPLLCYVVKNLKSNVDVINKTITFIKLGIYGPDKGDAFILGNSIKTNMNEIRSSIGFCPQHVIF